MNNNLLKGKKGIIFGALDEKSIAWITALRCHEEGAMIVLSNASVAIRMGEIEKLAEKISAPVIPCDVSKAEEVENLIIKSMEYFGGSFDFVHRVLAACMKHDAINDWGSVVALSYIAAQRIFPDYNEMADAKSLLESVARSFGYHYGVKKKVRVNTISQSPTKTTAGTGVKGFEGFISFAEKMSPLGNASAADCANYIVMMFSDLTKMVTMQNLFHDGGFSYTGVSQSVIEQMEK